MAISQLLMPVKAVCLFPFLWLNGLRQYLIAIYRWRKLPHLRQIELWMLLRYFFKEPFHICLYALRSYSFEEVQKGYGETFFTSMEQMLIRAKASADDVFYDLGCGRGRIVFFVHALLGCRCVGTDLVASFIKVAKSLVVKYQLKDIEFREDNIMTMSYEDATLIYLYATAFTEDAYPNLAKTLLRTPPGARIISVSFPLHEHTPDNAFTLLDHFRVSFLWGKADVFLYQRQESCANTSTFPDVTDK